MNGMKHVIAAGIVLSVVATLNAGSWSTAPSNLSTLKFKCVGNSIRNFSVVKKSDGLYLIAGTVLIVR